MAVITVAEQGGDSGYEIARKISQRLGFVLVDGALIGSKLNVSQSSDGEMLTELLLKGQIPPRVIKRLIIEQALKDNVVVLNLGGEILFQSFPGTLHVKINSTASTQRESRKLRREKERNYRRFIGALYGEKNQKRDGYDLQIKIDNMDTDFAADLVVNAVEIKGVTAKAGITWRALRKLKADLGRIDLSPQRNNKIKHLSIPSFAHPSEMDFARVLDFYRIKWEYEPRSFPIEWDDGGRVSEEFTPDFYLPELGLYIELTTLKQSLVTKKNRKIRRLKELYPDVNVKIFYRRDYKKFLQRFGIRQKNSPK